MANTINNATINAASVNVENMEDKDMMNMTVKELRVVAKAAGVKGYSRMNKADLVAAIEFFTNEERKAAESVVAPVIEEPVTVVEEKEDTVMSKYMNTKWDKLIKAVASEYVKQSLGKSWSLFYKNTKATATKAEYLVKSNRLWGTTAKVIKGLYGEQHCTEKTIQETLNAMVARGYLNFQKVQGTNGVNVIFNATADQMNAMYKLSKLSK